MTFAKMLNILQHLHENGAVGGWVGVSTGSEIMLSPTGQLRQDLHEYLLKKRFVYVDHSYIYRP